MDKLQDDILKEKSTQECPFLHANPSTHSKADEGDNLKKNVTDNDDTIEQASRKCFFVELKKGASLLNLSSFYLVQFSYVCFFSFMDIMQPHLIDQNENIIKGITPDEEDQVNTDLVFYDNLYLIGFIYIFGAFHDVLGRKFICSIGFLLIALALFLYPYAGVVYPNLLLFRLIFSNGICAVVTQPLLADYVKHTSKGFCGGISALLSGLGALFAVFGLMKLSMFMSYQSIYAVTACFSLFVSVFCMFGVKNMNYTNLNSTQAKDCKTRCLSIFQKMKIGIKELTSNTKLIFGVITNVQARFNSTIVTIILSLWVRKFYEDKKVAYDRTMMISGIGSTIGMVSAIIFGFLYEKAKIKVLLTINNLCIVVGYSTLLFWNDAKNSLIIISFLFSYFGFYGLTTVGFVIISKNVGCEARGAVMGLNSLFGALGIVIMMKVGGLLFNKLSINTPFMISAGVSLLVLILIYIPAISDKLEENPVNTDETIEEKYETDNQCPITNNSMVIQSGNSVVDL